MSDQFDELMQRAGFDESSFKEAALDVIGPDEADDHMVLHLLEALTEIAGHLSAEQFVIDWVRLHSDDKTADEVAYMLTVGTHVFMTACLVAGGDLIEPGSPARMEMFGWMRRVVALMTHAMQAWLHEKNVPIYYSWVWLSSHGHFPFVLHARPKLEMDESWKRDSV